jgi:hypothetical protein
MWSLLGQPVKRLRVYRRPFKPAVLAGFLYWDRHNPGEEFTLRMARRVLVPEVY